MPAVMHKPFVGADCDRTWSFGTRVLWYAVWIKAYPLSAVHIRYVSPDGAPVGSGFLIDLVSGE